MAKVINGKSIPNMPWQDRPEGCDEVVWRYSENPILSYKDIKKANTLFNSSVVEYKGEFRGIFRCDRTDMVPFLYKGKSKDGIHWDIEDEAFKFENEIEGVPYVYGYDPRVCEIDGRYYIVWCTGMQNWDPTIGMAYTDDFEKIYRMENAFLPYNRNGVLFPRKINDKYVMFSRPSDTGYGKPGDGSIYYSESPDMIYWGKHRRVMSPSIGWQSYKIGGGPTPIETDEGWLMIYHGVKSTCNGVCYYAGAALLDIDNPSKVLYRTRDYILSPRELYERVGDVDNVVFPVSTLCDADTGRIAIYYGAADTVVGIAFTTVDELIKFTKENSL